jgi:hypothetical protein
VVGAAGGECLELGRLWKRLSFFNPAVDWPATGRHSNPCLMFEVKRGAQKLMGKNRLGRVFNCKLGCFVMCAIEWPLQVRPSLQWKTWPRFRLVSLSLSMG